MQAQIQYHNPRATYISAFYPEESTFTLTRVEGDQWGRMVKYDCTLGWDHSEETEDRVMGERGEGWYAFPGDGEGMTFLLGMGGCDEVFRSWLKINSNEVRDRILSAHEALCDVCVSHP